MRVLLFETRTGHPVMDLQRTDWSYDTGILAQDKLDAVIPAYTRWASTLDLQSLLVRDKYSLAFINEEVQGRRIVEAAGPIVQPTPAEDADGNNVYKVGCRGEERLLEWRKVRLFPGWPLIDAQGFPTGTYDQTFENVSYGTIMKYLVAESEKFPGGELPLVYEADRPGIHERSAYAAIDGRSVLEAMDQLAELADGVEYDFQPQIDEYDNITYKLVTGTDSDRFISSGEVKVWNLGGNRPDIRGYERAPDPEPIITDAVFSGGKEDDKVLLAASHDHSPLSEGFPKAELWDNSHSTVSVQATLQSWADQSLGGIPDRISFDVKADQAYGVRHGDHAKLVARGHWDLPDGEYDVRVLSKGRSSSDPDWVHIELV